MVMTKVYKEISLREREILRYAGCRTEEKAIVRLMQECLQETERIGVFGGQLCYVELPVAVRGAAGGRKNDSENQFVANKQVEYLEELSVMNGMICDFGCFSVRSEQLAKNLQGCDKVLLLAATAGVGIDRLIGKYGRIAPSKALMFQAIGAELVEAVCDRFSKEYEKERNCILRPRFSPGYGDLPLEVQKAIFAVLDCAKKIGLTLNDSLLMSPSKSVTAFVGIIAGEPECTIEMGKDEEKGKCEVCEKRDCAYRGE